MAEPGIPDRSAEPAPQAEPKAPPLEAPPDAEEPEVEEPDAEEVEKVTGVPKDSKELSTL